MVFNGTFNKFQLHRGGQFYWWRKPEYPEKTTDLPQATDRNRKIYNRYKCKEFFFAGI